MEHITYLIKVLTKWTEWCKHHRQLKEAITYVLLENQKLKIENETLKEKLKNVK